MLVLLAGCAANGPKYTNSIDISKEKGNLYIYRPYALLSGGLSANVFVDDKLMGTLKNGGYIKLSLTSGGHSIRVGKQHKSFTVTKNNKSFFKFTYGWSLFFVVPFVPQSLESVAKGLAVSELSETSLSI